MFEIINLPSMIEGTGIDVEKGINSETQDGINYKSNDDSSTLITWLIIIIIFLVIAYIIKSFVSKIKSDELKDRIVNLETELYELKEQIENQKEQ